MRFVVRPSALHGPVLMPASKSHTVRAAVFASLAEGTSVVRNPLESLDGQAAARACQALGATFQFKPGEWIVDGVAGRPHTPENVIDVANSGTTLRCVMGAAALSEGWTVLTGDEQIRARPAGPLIQALNDLSAKAFSTRGNGSCPIIVGGPMKGGETTIKAVTSQYVTAILISAPLAPETTILNVVELNEAPYVGMTLTWLDSLGIRYEMEGEMERFTIPGGQSYPSFDRFVPGDFSSATFFLGAGAALNADIEVRGLDMNDTQGDKAVVDYVKAMGAQVDIGEDVIRVRRGELRGVDLDLNATPDALPMMAVLGALAEGTTRLLNVPQARVKETDRIAVMAEELTKMGARIEELPDGLVIEGGALTGASVCGHGDHRVVMSLAVAGMAVSGETTIDTAESAAVTFPNFADLMRSIGANIDTLDDE